MEISFYSHPNCSKVVPTKLCTWHDSCAIVTSTNFCCDMISSKWITVKWNFHRMWIVEETASKRVPLLQSIIIDNWMQNHQGIKCPMWVILAFAIAGLHLYDMFITYGIAASFHAHADWKWWYMNLTLWHGHYSTIVQWHATCRNSRVLS